MAGWIIGTLVIWGLKLLTMPLAKLFAGDKVTRTVVPDSTPAGSSIESKSSSSTDESEANPFVIPPDQVAEPKVVETVPTGYYILADVLVLGAAGLLLGLITGWYFVGFSWKAKDWPGMIVFVLASLVGSFIHG